MSNNRFLRFVMRPVVVGLLMFFSLLLLTQVLVHERYLLLRETELRKLNDEADAAKERLQSTLSSSLSCTQTLAFVVERYGVPKEFDSVAKRLLRSDKLIDEIELVRGGVITNIYPLKGNEPALGYNILEDSVNNRGAFVAIRTKEFFFAGPTYLKQGGIGVIGRQPIFINGKFWGFAAVIIRLPNLLKTAGIDSIGNSDFTYQLVRIDPKDGSEEYFLPDHLKYNDDNSVPVDIPNSEWKLYVREKSNTSFLFMITFSIMGLVLSFIGGAFTWFMTKQPQELKKLVDEKTVQITASEEKYRLLVEHAGDAIFLVNSDTTFWDVNSSASRLLGYTREEFLHMKIGDLYAPEELQKNPLRWDLLQKNKSLLSERRLKRKDGTEVDVEIHSKLQDGKGFLAIVRDITDRIKAEEAVINAYKDKEIVLNRISDSVVSVDNNWRYTFLNDGAMATHPQGRQQTIGKSIWDIHPEMKGTVFWDKYHEAMETGRVVEAESYYAPFDTWFSVKIYPSSDGLTIFYTDVTASKKIEQEIIREKNLSASIINSLPGAFYLYDQTGKFIRWNKNFETVSGYSAEEVSNMHPLDFFEDAEKPLLEKRIGEVFEKGMAEVEAPLLTKDKRKIPYYFNGHLANLDGKDYLIGMGIDITAREKAQREMVLEKNLSESIINSMPGIFYLANFDGQLLRWNKNFETVSGYSPNELSQMRLKQFLTEDELPAMLVSKQKAIDRGMIDIEANFVTKQGVKIPYFLTSRRTQYNEQPCLLGVGVDITERKKAEELLVKNEHKYRSLIEQASDPIMVTDFEGNFTDVNTSLCNVFGYTKEELLKLNIRTLIDPEQLGERPIRFDLLAIGQHIFADRKMIRRDGTIIEVEANVKKVDDNYVMAIARDVTQLRQTQREIQISEARFRGAFESSAIGMALATLEGRWMKVNNRLSEITGYTADELVQMTFREITHPDDIAGDMPLVQQLRAGEIESFQREKRYLHKNGSSIWVNVAASVVRDPQGVPLYTVAQIENINERKKAQEALKESEARYRALVENAPEALVVMDMELGKFVSVSESAEALFGMTKEELLNVGPVDVSPEYQPNGRLSSEMAMDKINQAIAGSKPSFEWTHHNKNGNPIPCEIWLVRLPSDKRVLVRGSIIDISERKRAEQEKEHARYLLNERVKELTTLYNTGRILQTEHRQTELILQEIVNILPAGWQFPEICEARITLGSVEFRTANYKESEFRQTAAFATLGNVTGTIEVVYRHKKPVEAEGPFLAEERHLINMLAEMIRVFLNQKHEAEELNSSYSQLRLLSSHLQTVREEERANISREIHDELGQQLTGLKMDTSWLKKKIAEEDVAAREKVSDMLSLIDHTVTTVRRISSELRPGVLDDLGLVAALEWQSSEFEKRTGIRSKFNTPAFEMDFEKNIAIGIFRVYQETLTNVARHSKATLVETDVLQKGNYIELQIIDNGCGFDVAEIKAKKTLGLIGMKERALMFNGELNIESEPGKGTRIILKVPLTLHNTLPST